MQEISRKIFFTICGWGLGSSKVVITFNHVDRSFNLFKFHHQGYLNNPIFSNVGLCAACWAQFVHYQELWPTSVSHPFFSISCSLGLDGGKHYQKITIPIFRLLFQTVALLACFHCILFCSCLFSSIPSGLYVIAVCGCISVQRTS